MTHDPKTQQWGAIGKNPARAYKVYLGLVKVGGPLIMTYMALDGLNSL